MKTSDRLQLRQSELRQELNGLAATEGDLTEEQQKRIKELDTEYRANETKLRAAIIAESEEEDRARETFSRDGGDTHDAEAREKEELRRKALVTNWFAARAEGRPVGGAEAEYSVAMNARGNIPLSLWEKVEDARRDGSGPVEHRVITPAPSVSGTRLDVIAQEIFSPSIAQTLRLDMPQVGPGLYAHATVGSGATAGARNKSAAAPQTAGSLTVTSASPRRIAASLALAVEDIAAVASNFEEALRANIQLNLSDELDRQLISGNGTAPNLTGFLTRLTNPASTIGGTAVPTWDQYNSVFADAVDGLFAMETAEIAVICGPLTYQNSAKAFRDPTGTGGLGEISFADYARKMFGPMSWRTNVRMPAAASNVQASILCRKGRPGRLSVSPVWGYLSIDDPYSRSLEGERQFTVSVLVGDVIMVQPDAYAQVNYRTAA